MQEEEYTGHASQPTPPEGQDDTRATSGGGSAPCDGDGRLGESGIHWQTPLGQRVSNFFYYYKWHLIVAVVAVLIVVICAVQCSQRTTYDGYILYAGGSTFPRTGEEGDLSVYEEALATMRRHTGDHNGDGQIHVSFVDLFQPSQEEIRQIEQGGEYEVNYSLISQDAQRLGDLMLFGDYYVCLLSSSVFEGYESRGDGVHYFTPVSAYVTGEGYAYASEYGVYLSSLRISGEAGFSHLPGDTVLCLRARNEVVGALQSDGDAAKYADSEALFRQLLTLK